MTGARRIADTSVQRHGSVGEGRLRLAVAVGAESEPGRSALLTETVYEVIRFLADAEAVDPGGSAVIDVRVPALADPRLAAEAEAFVSASKGLMQAWVLERGAASCRANLVVSSPDQVSPREQTVEYFDAELGAAARGTSYDLREAR